jgi:3-oxoadipate enol-lactonase
MSEPAPPSTDAAEATSSERGAATKWVPDLPPGRWIELAGEGRLFVRDFGGPPGSPTLMLLHGWTATSDLNWFTAYQSLGARFRVIAFDHRGHGRGLRTRRRFRLTDCADDAADVAGALGIERFIVAGYSMGGAIATLLWRRHRTRVDGLVLCATASTFFDTRAERVRLGLLDPISLATRAIPSRGAQRLYERVVWTQTKERNYKPWMIDEIRSCHPRLVLEAGAELGRFDSRPWRALIDVPTSVVVTTRDNLVPTARQESFVAAIPGAERFAVDGDHVACVSRPEQFVPALIDACTSVVDRVSVGR